LNAITKVLNDNQIDYVSQRIPAYQTLGNIMIEFNNDETPKIVLSAHYDNALGTPGANDNAAGCSILLNLIINLKNTKKHIEFVFFDLEENHRIGSREYMRLNQGKISYAINLDMCGMGENILLSQHHMKEDLSDIYTKHHAIIMKRLPPGDADTFINYKCPTFFVINSTNPDLEWFKQFADSMPTRIVPDFSKTMHCPNDTIDTINFVQVEKIYLFVSDLIQALSSLD